jgi:hypothetical protein
MIFLKRFLKRDLKLSAKKPCGSLKAIWKPPAGSEPAGGYEFR